MNLRKEKLIGWRWLVSLIYFDSLKKYSIGLSTQRQILAIEVISGSLKFSTLDKVDALTPISFAAVRRPFPPPLLSFTVLDNLFASYFNFIAQIYSVLPKGQIYFKKILRIIWFYKCNTIIFVSSNERNHGNRKNQIQNKYH